MSGDTFLVPPDPISMVEHDLVPRPPFNPGGGFGNETIADCRVVMENFTEFETIADHQLQGSDGAS